MSWNYLTTLTTDRDIVRFNIGDRVENEGVRPDGANFSDEEITYLLTKCGSVDAACVLAFRILANEWTQYALTEREGEASLAATNVADMYRQRAKDWANDTGVSLGAAMTTGLNFRKTDDGGSPIEPVFQRKQMGNKPIDWDVS